MFKNILLLFLLLSIKVCFSLELAVIEKAVEPSSPIFSTIETNLNYGFSYPVKAAILTELNYQPNYSNRYFMSVFGPRYKQVTSSNVGYFDFHRGTDITANVSNNGVNFTESMPPDIVSMCDGIVDSISTDVNSAIGFSATIKCNKIFTTPDWGNVYIAYRHLSSINIVEQQILAQEDLIGLMGDSGLTNTVHLHLSVQRNTINGKVNVHPMRIFDQLNINHLSSAFVSAPVIDQLSYNETQALFRITTSYNQANIRAIRVGMNDSDWSRTYDFEEVSEFATNNNRDHNDWKNGLELFAYPFNRGQRTYQRYLDKREDMPEVYPASLKNDPQSIHPLLSLDTQNYVSYVVDVKAVDLPLGYDISQLFVEIYDIWGNGYRAYGQEDLALSRTHVIVKAADDAEEKSTGVMDLSSIDLDMFDSGNNSLQLIGLQFSVNDIPQNALVTNAYIQFSADEVNSENTNLIIGSEDTLIPEPYGNNNHDLSQRQLMSNQVLWDIDPWINVDDMGVLQKTPNLASIIQPLVSSSDWNIGKKVISFIVSGSGRRVADSGDNFFLRKKPYLFVEYDTTNALFDLIFKQGFE